jgi:hypothetical protein
VALTKFEIASSAMIMIGANPVSSFSSAGTAEEIACYHLYQSCIDHWLSLFPWRFASRTTQMNPGPPSPEGKWQRAFVQPTGMKALQAITIDRSGHGIPFDRFENLILCNAGDTQAVYAVHTYEPPIAWWPGYFVALAEQALAAKFAFAMSAKLDLRVDLEKSVETYFRLAKNADSRQQTTRRFPVSGRRSIMEARRA